MRRRLSILILLVLGVLLLVFNEQVVEFIEEFFGAPDQRPIVATVENYEGSVNFKLPKTLYYKKVKEGQGLRSLDTVVTADNSRVILTFSSGYKLEIAPNSIVIIEEPTAGADGVFRITFLRGDFRVIDKGSGQLVVSKDNVLQDAAGRAPPPPLQIVQKPKPTPTPEPTQVIKQAELEEVEAIQKPTPKPTPKRSKETLPDEYIAQIIKKQTPFFNRCYAEHLRLNPNARGRINVTFTIASSGNVSNVRILGSTLKDPRLEQCTSSVIERARFRKFDGDPIVINYPINFE